MYNEEENIEPEFLKQRGPNPFRVPEGYFDSLESRIMEGIQVTNGKKRRPVNVVRILKPVLGIAASIVFVYLLTNIPFTKSTTGTKSSAISLSAKDDSTFNFSLIDESTLANAIFSEEENKVDNINPEEMLAYLSSGLNEVQIYSEIQN